MTTNYQWQMTCPMCGTSHPEGSEQATRLATTQATPAAVLEHALRDVIRTYAASDDEMIGRHVAYYIARAEKALGK